MRIQRSAEHRLVPWANGLSITADVFLWPPGVAEWTWRLSIADFVAHGAGMALVIDGAPEHRMDRTTPPLSFHGWSPPHAAFSPR